MSTPSTARATSSTTSTSRCTKTRSSRCSAATAPASPTLLKTLVGIAPAANGSIRLADVELIGNSSAQNARLGIGYVPQGRGLFAGMSVEQKSRAGGLKRQTGNGVHWTRERIYEYFPRIKERLDSPRTISPAASSRWWRWPARCPGDVRVLLLDEPFEGLAPDRGRAIVRNLRRLRKEIAIIHRRPPSRSRAGVVRYHGGAGSAAG
jgi:ABC-type branched-subunit amino acid transport system ATPase component